MYTGEIRCDDGRDGKIICSKSNTSEFQKVRKYAYFIMYVFFKLFLKYQESFSIAAITDTSMLAGSLLTQICNDWQNINAV